MKKRLVLSQLLLLPLLFCLFACGGGKKETSATNGAMGYTVEYARGFQVNRQPDYTVVTVRDPWDTIRVLQQYILVEKSASLPASLPSGKLIRTPLTNVVAYSTIHCATLQELQSIGIIKGVCESKYIDIPYIKQAVAEGRIPDLGMAGNPDIERVIMLSPDAIFATPIQGMPYGNVEKTGIPMIETPDYMESSPLGRAEWIRFYSLFIGKEALADSLFHETVGRYRAICEKTKQVDRSPSVFMDLKYGNVWYIAGGKSFLANMVKDAGANYIWADDSSTGALPLAFETVLDKTGEAEIWLVKYNNMEDLTYLRLANEYKPYSYFTAFKNRSIYECNTGKSTYYEDLPIHPDYILQDMAFVFHPELFPGYEPKYYQKMKE